MNSEVSKGRHYSFGSVWKPWETSKNARPLSQFPGRGRGSRAQNEDPSILTRQVSVPRGGLSAGLSTTRHARGVRNTHIPSKSSASWLEDLTVLPAVERPAAKWNAMAPRKPSSGLELAEQARMSRGGTNLPYLGYLWTMVIVQSTRRSALLFCRGEKQRNSPHTISKKAYWGHGPSKAQKSRFLIGSVLHPKRYLIFITPSWRYLWHALQKIPPINGRHNSRFAIA
ncbi:hypothetical protein B0H14DRAFT_619152 [Mycena olivaceomarginata]|nr:hypothetical protein B0H14DRAFT_619152 [Mycena olivaceomarginata]